MAPRPRLNSIELEKRQALVAADEKKNGMDIYAPENSYLHLPVAEWTEISEDARDFLMQRQIKTLADFRYWQFGELLLGQPEDDFDTSQRDKKISDEIWKKSLECGVIWHPYYDPDQEGAATLKNTLEKGRMWYHMRQERHGNIAPKTDDKTRDLKTRYLLKALYKDKKHILMLPVDQVPGAPKLRFARDSGCNIVAELAAKTKEEHIANGMKKGLVPHMIHGLKKLDLRMGLFQEAAKTIGEAEAGRNLTPVKAKPADPTVAEAQKAYYQLFGFNL